MTNEKKIEACVEFFKELENLLVDTYESVGSCNNDISTYLIPKGTLMDLSYHGKPAKSFRVSDHWNWYSNLRKNSNPNYIQCYSVDLPRARKRPEPGKASRPIAAAQVGYYDEDNKYHAVFGEVYDRKKKEWSWLYSNPEEVVESIGLT